MSKATKNKRVNMSKDKKFAVIETVQGNADVLVEFIPNIWFKLENKKAVKVRESAKCYYPRRMANQSIDQYLKSLKHAKFECLEPAEDNKWDVLECRVLKVGIASFTDAVEAEKFFSDFFNTTDAEAKMHASPLKRLRKTKRSKTQRVSLESESDDEGAKVSGKVAEISDYNATFKQLVIRKEVSFDSTSSHLPVDTISTNHRASDDTYSSVKPIQNIIDLNNVSEFVDIDVNKTSHHPSVVHNANNVPDQLDVNEPDQLDVNEPEEAHVVFEFIDQQVDSNSKGKCNCCQKLMNKMDYMQKKFLKELGRYRQETLQAIRLFSDRYDVLLKSQEFQGPELAKQAASQAQDDEFEAEFKDSFPRATKDLLIDTNKTIQSDRDFKKRLISKLKRIIGSSDCATEEKSIRQILKAVGTSSCFSEFTWNGTDKKGNFSALEALIEVITSVVESKFPKVDAYVAVKKVVQQRTKSAAESEAKKRLNNGDVGENEEFGVDQPIIIDSDANNQGSSLLFNGNPGAL